MLAVVLEAYFSFDEMREMAEMFSVTLPDTNQYDAAELKRFWIRTARQLVEGVESGSNHALLASILEQLDVKNSVAIGRTDYERRQANEALSSPIYKLKQAFDRVAVPSSVVVPEGMPFRAKAEIRDMLATATGDVFVVDPYIGVGTLDCFLTVAHPIQLLTGIGSQSIEAGFDRALQAFRDEGREIEVRRTSMLHDRHLVFNARCWLVGSSLKDAGKKAFNCIEIIDRDEVVAELRRKWEGGTTYP